MTDPAGTDRSDAELVEELVFRCLEASDLHAAVAQCCAEHPQLADRVRRVLARLEGEQLVGTGSAGAPLCAAAIGDRELPERLGHFRILSRLGAGGMGVVYLAEDEQLARQVAVKLVRPEQLFFPGARERFRREIEAIARLHHPGIVTIHSVGEEHGMPFFAMDYVRGKSLAQVIAELAGTEPARLREQDLRDRIAPGAEPSGSTTAHGSWVRLCIELVRDLADALQHAHEQGVVHRDVKPSNVLIGPDLRPRLLDFGLARADDSQQLTRSSSQLGSLPYMAPEQLDGSAAPSPKLDVYALGVTLYELLTLRSPFLGATAEQTRANILAAAPTPLRAANPAVSRDLDTVCRTAMDPAPARRYADMAALLADLDNLLARRPIRARPAGPLLRGWRWCQRHPAASVGLAMAALLFVLVAAFAWHQERVARATERTNYRLGVRAAALQLEQFRTLEAKQSLDLCPEHLRRYEWHHLQLLANGHDAVYRGHAGRILQLALHPDGVRFASAGEDGVVRIRHVDDAGSEHVLRLAAPGDDPVRALGCAFSPDGGHLFATGDDGRVLRWRADGSESVTIRTAPAPPVRKFAVDPVRGRQAWALSNGELRLVAVAADGSLAADDALAIAAPAAIPGLPGYVPPIEALCFSPDGARLYAARLDRVALVDLATCREVASLAHDEAEIVTMVATSADGARLLTGTSYGRLRLWDTATQQLLASSDPSRTMGVNAGVFDEQRGQVHVAGAGGPIATHDLHDLALIRLRLGHDSTVTDLALSSDRRALLTTSYDATVRRWDVDSAGAVQLIGTHDGLVRTLELTPDSRYAITGGKDGRLMRWDLRGGPPRELLGLAEPSQAGVLATSLAPDGRRLLVVTDRVWLVYVDGGVDGGPGGGADAQGGRGHAPQPVAMPERPRLVAWLPDGDRFAALTGAGELQVVEPGSGRVIASVGSAAEADERLTHLAVCPWSGRIVTAGTTGYLTAWDPRTLAVVAHASQPLDRVRALGVDARTRQVIAADALGTIRCWDPASGRPAAADLAWPNQVISSIDTSPDGARLITSTMGRQIQIWDLQQRHELLLLGGHHSLAITRARFTPDGERIVSVSMDGTVRVWNSSRPGG